MDLIIKLNLKNYSVNTFYMPGKVLVARVASQVNNTQFRPQIHSEGGSRKELSWDLLSTYCDLGPVTDVSYVILVNPYNWSFPISQMRELSSKEKSQVQGFKVHKSRLKCMSVWLQSEAPSKKPTFFTNPIANCNTSRLWEHKGERWTLLWVIREVVINNFF